MLLRLPLLLSLGILSPLAGAQEVTIQGKIRKLQPKPKTPYQQQDGLQTSYRGRLDLPASVDLRSLQTPVKDQGDRGSCAYFTTVALFEHTLKRKHPEQRDLNLSEEYLIYANKAIDGYNKREDGSHLSTNIKSLLRHGLLAEEQHPYSHSWFETGMPCAEFEDNTEAPIFCRSHFAPKAEALAAVVTPEAYQFQVRRLGSMGEVLERLAGGEAVTISLPVHEDGWEGGEDGLVVHDQALETECDSKPDLCGGHTVLLTGYDQEKKLFTFKNSWGESWGQGGYGQLSYEYFKDWTYGEWFVLDLVRLDKEPQSPPFEKKLSSVGHAVRWDKNAEGEEGVWVDLRFDYQAPLGTFYYVSLFAQTKKPKTEDQATDEPQYENVLLETEAGESDLILDRRFILSQSKDDLSFSEGRPLSLFLPKSSLEKAGVLGREDLVLRPTIYGMSDRESYQILNRVYLTVPPLGTGDRRTVNSARLTSFP